MRWERLFDDLEARFDALGEADLRAELAERERIAAGGVTLAARLAGARGEFLRIRLISGAQQTGRLGRVGPDWLLLEPAAGQQLLIASSAVTVVEGLDRRTGPAPSGLAMKLDLRYMVRGLARDRTPVSLILAGGVELTGTFDRIGQDFVELAQHAPWEPRRTAAVRSVATVPLSALVAVRAVPLG